MDRFVVTARPLSIDAAWRSVRRTDCGGICLFVGTVRETNEGRRVRRMRYTAYREMALSTFRTLAREARARHGLKAVYLAHRTGMLRLGEPSVVVAAAAPHRAEAFAGCRRLIDRLKRISPIWKEEFTTGGKRWLKG